MAVQTTAHPGMTFPGDDIEEDDFNWDKLLWICVTVIVSVHSIQQIVLQAFQNFPLLLLELLHDLNFLKEMGWRV